TATSAAAIRIGSEDRDCWKACAVPWNEPVKVTGAPSLSRARCTSCVAWPSETPGARLNVSVADGNWLWWLIDRALVAVGSALTNNDSGTVLPVSGDNRRTLLNRAGVACWAAGASSTT